MVSRGHTGDQQPDIEAGTANTRGPPEGGKSGERLLVNVLVGKVGPGRRGVRDLREH